MKTLIRKQHPVWNEFPLTFDSLFNDLNSGSVGYKSPAVNVREDDNGFNLEVSAPGFKKGDFNVNLDGHRLTISAEAKSESEEANEKFTRREFSLNSFERSFMLPKGVVNEDSISANYEDGILKINLPKAEAAKPKPAKMIEIG